MNYYEILQIPRTASDEEIKRAYQELVRKHHPDKSADANREQFQQIDRAYKVFTF